MKKKYGATLIIGNGMDLSLGMVTGYRSFFHELEEKGFFQEYESNPLLKYIYDKGVRENWYDFENIIKEYATKGEQAIYLKMIEEFLPKMNGALEMDGTISEFRNYEPLVGISKELEEVIQFASNHTKYDFVTNSNIKQKCVIIKGRLNLYVKEQRQNVKIAKKLLTEELRSFLRKAKIKVDTPIAIWILFAIIGIFDKTDKGYAEGIVKYADNNGIYKFPNFRIISFNYTDTFKEVINWLENKYGISICLDSEQLTNEFIRIHGTLQADMIFGIDDNSSIPNAFLSLRKSQNISIDAKKKFQNIIESSERIIILGHSICGIDFEYYEDFFKENSDTKVTILCHSEEALEAIKEELENKGITHRIEYVPMEISRSYVNFCKEIADEQVKFFESRNI